MFSSQNLIPCFLTFCSTIEFNPYLRTFKFLIFYHSSVIVGIDTKTWHSNFTCLHLYTVLCKENFANIGKLITTIRKCVTNIHEQFTNVYNALFRELNFCALALRGCEHSAFLNVDPERS